MPKESIPTVAVLIPCLNEALTIGKVVRDFQKALPQAKVYVCDNGSTDGSPDIAKQAKAHLFHETLRGKGYAVRRMFQDIDADIYLLVDGDDTYDPALAPTMVLDILEGHFDLVNAIRSPVEGENAYRYGHRFGNRLLTKAVRTIFGDRVKDMLSGYKAMSRRFVKSFPALSEGFEIETEIVVHALELGLSIGHREGFYKSRPEGSVSKLNSYRDGSRILLRILVLFKQEKPFFLFLIIGSLFVLLSFLAGIPVIMDYLRTQEVPRLPTAVLATGLMLLGFLNFLAGSVLDSVSRSGKEAKRLSFLFYPKIDPGH